MSDALRLRLLGRFEAGFAGGPELTFKGRKTQALLALLALAEGAPTPRDRLIGLLWSDRGEEQARASLRQALADLRRGLGDAAGDLLIATRETLALAPQGLDCDVHRLRQLRESASVEDLSEAVSLYRGDLLEGLSIADPAFEDWLQQERAACREDALAVLGKLLARQEDADDFAGAISTARTLLMIDPLQEGAHRSLMKAYAAEGDRALALKQFETCKELLRAELGVAPQSETAALAQSLRQDEHPKAGDAPDEGSGGAPAPAARPALPEKPSLVVLPFTNMSGDAEQEYFADGITEDIITELSRFRSLFVIASNSSFHYKGKSPKVQEVGRDLGVAFVVEGSVRKAGNRVRITAQLVEAENGAHLWAERYDRDLDDIFAVQDEVAAEIVTAVPGHLDIANRVAAERKPAKDLTAYDLLLRGEAIFYQDWTSKEAHRLFERAVEVDPNYARAHARLANYLGYAVFCHGLDYDEACVRVRKHVERALELDANDPFVQATAAESYILLGDHELARHHIEKATILNPNDITVMIYAGINNAYLGDHAEGLRWMKLAARRDPYSSDAVRESFFDCYFLAGDYEAAIDQLKGWRNPPPHMWVTAAAGYALMDRMEEAKEAAERFKSLSPDLWDRPDIRRAHLRMCAKAEDRERLHRGYELAGVPI